jgi:hypothetical protein
MTSSKPLSLEENGPIKVTTVSRAYMTKALQYLMIFSLSAILQYFYGDSNKSLGYLD